MFNQHEEAKVIVAFELKMPIVGYLNGRWSGEKGFYLRTRCFLGKKGIRHAQRILGREYYSYNFGDGWTAGITVKQVTPDKAAKLRRKSSGFCGYDWMVDSIINHGEIRNWG